MNDYADAIRFVSVLLCTAVVAGLLWRMIGRWSLSFPLGRAVVALWAALELIVALGTAARAQLGGPFSPAQYLIIGHSLASLALIVYWPRLRAIGEPKA